MYSVKDLTESGWIGLSPREVADMANAASGTRNTTAPSLFHHLPGVATHSNPNSLCRAPQHDAPQVVATPRVCQTRTRPHDRDICRDRYCAKVACSWKKKEFRRRKCDEHSSNEYADWSQLHESGIPQKFMTARKPRIIGSNLNLEHCYYQFRI